MQDESNRISDGLGDFTKYLNQAQDWAVHFLPKLVLASLVVWLGFKLANRLHRIVDASLRRSGISLEISTFLESIVDILLKGAVLLVAASFLGFEVSSLLGVLAAAGFAVGLALQGFLGNFAAGITIVFFKPYKVGDWVEVADGKFGQVQSIQIFNTTILTPNLKTHIIPNGQVTESVITNYSKEGMIRLELTVTMPYKESYPRVKEAILEALDGCLLILHEPAPLIGIESYDSHSINVAVRPFIDPPNFWAATFEVNHRIKQAFHRYGVEVAYSEGVEHGRIGD